MPKYDTGRFLLCTSSAFPTSASHTSAILEDLELKTTLMADSTTSAPGKVSHAASPSFKAKPNLYEAEYMGSGTFRISKPKRKETKRRQSALKGTTRGSRK
jgi:hypothetical protein